MEATLWMFSGVSRFDDLELISIDVRRGVHLEFLVWMYINLLVGHSLKYQLSRTYSFLEL